MNLHLLLLALCQGLFLTNNVTFIAINGLVGLSLAPNSWMATLPITGYVAGGALYTEAYRPEARTTAQAAMDTVVFSTMTLTSFSSGALVTTQGWTWLNRGSTVPLVLVAAALLWLAMRRRHVQNPGST